MIRALRSRAAQSAPDAGITLIELIVASVVSLLMLTIVSATFIQIAKLTASAQSTRVATGVAWTVMDELSGVVRQGTQVDTSSTATEGAVLAGSTPNALVIDAYVNAAVAGGQPTIAPTRVTFGVNASGYLTEQRVLGVAAGGYYAFTGTPTSRTVNGPLVTTGAGNALFTYYAGGTVLVPGSTGLTADQAGQVTAVGITVTVASAGTAGPDPVRLVNTITMPNLAILNGGS